MQTEEGEIKTVEHKYIKGMSLSFLLHRKSDRVKG